MTENNGIRNHLQQFARKSRFMELADTRSLPSGCKIRKRVEMKTLVIGTLLVALVVAPAHAASVQMEKLFASQAVEAQIREKLNDPDSMRDIQSVVKPGRLTNGRPGWMVYMAFRAKNAFGGLIKQKAVGLTDQTGQICVASALLDLP